MLGGRRPVGTPPEALHSLPPSAGRGQEPHLPELGLECGVTRTGWASSTPNLDLGVWLLPHLIVARVNDQEPPDGGLMRPKKGLLSRLSVGDPLTVPLGQWPPSLPPPKWFSLFLGHPSLLHGPTCPGLSPGLPSAFL